VFLNLKIISQYELFFYAVEKLIKVKWLILLLFNDFTILIF